MYKKKIPIYDAHIIPNKDRSYWIKQESKEKELAKTVHLLKKLKNKQINW